MQELISKLKDNIGSRFIGKDAVIHNMITALLAGGHILIEDVPGVGKTTLAKALAGSIDSSFARIQFTPDTLPTDVVGTSIYDAKETQFRVVKGPIHNQIVLADEINRTSPRTQSALLEAMEEGQVTIDGNTFVLPELFMVIATQNPSENIGTYPLPEAELDRFMMKISLGYPDREMQIRLSKNYLDGVMEDAVQKILSAEDVVNMKKEVREVKISDEVLEYALEIVDGTRGLEELKYGLSPRAALDLLMASKADAYIRGRDYVIPEDVIEMAGVTLPHRLVLTAKARMDRYTAEQLLTRVTDKISRPR